MQTGIYLPDGDLDIVVNDDRLRYHSTYSVLSTLKTAVVKCQFAQQHEVRLISGTKVPIVKLKTSNSFGRFDMDISFNSDKGPEGARESLRLLKEVEMRRRGNAERVKRLALLLKTLLVTYDLNEVRDGGIGGLTVFCIALSHVQLDDASPSSDPRHEAALDLLRFLYRYAYGFDYQQQTITTAGGGGLLHKATRFPDSRPERLSIVHPVELNRDLASGSYGYEQVVARLRFAYDKLKDFSSFFADHARLALCGPSLCVFGVSGFWMSEPSRLQRETNAYLIQNGKYKALAGDYYPVLHKPLPTAYETCQSGHGRLHEPFASQCVTPPTRTYESRSYAQTSQRSYGVSYVPSTRHVHQPGAQANSAQKIQALPAPRAEVLATSSLDIDQVFARMSISSFSPPMPMPRSPEPFISSPAGRSSSHLEERAQPVSLQSSSPASNGSTPLSTPSDSSHGDEVVYKAPSAAGAPDLDPAPRELATTSSSPRLEPSSQGPQPLTSPTSTSMIHQVPRTAAATAARWNPQRDPMRSLHANITLADWSYTPSASSTRPSLPTPTMWIPPSWDPHAPTPPDIYWL